MLENPIKEDIDSENDFKIQFILFGVWCLIMSNNETCCQTFFPTSSQRHHFNKQNELGQIYLLLLLFFLCMKSKSLTLTNKVVFLITFYFLW